jgi:hypothetical protein
MNLSNHKTYIEKLCIMSNNSYIYDEQYIKNKYNIKSYDKFRKYFKKNHNDKLIFNSEKSEKFFIQVMNLDAVYMLNKYGNNALQNIVDFFIQTNDCYFFNMCDEISAKNNKNIHLNECKCNIKVKSVVNLSINALIFILIENHYSDKVYLKIENIEDEKYKNETIVAKLQNNNSNKKMIDSIKKLESIKMKLGMNKDNIDYQLTDTKPENIILDKEIIDTKETKQTDIFKNVDEEELNNFNEKINELCDNKINIKKLEEQLISESVNLDEENESFYQKKKIFKTIENTKIEKNSESERYNNLMNYAENKSFASKFKLSDLESENTNELQETNRFGNVIIIENKVKIEKKEPIDLKNSSDILVSYNDYELGSTNIKNNFVLPNQDIIVDNKTAQNETLKTKTSETKTSETKTSETKTSETKTSETKTSETKMTFDEKKTLTEEIITNERVNKEIFDDKNEISKDKKEVLEILENLNKNFNYITSDDILIDKDKKMQICTFMVEIKYKIYGMFRQIEKNKIINSQNKSKIMNNYEKIYQYVIQSNKIGSTGEMIEFKKHKELIDIIIEDIIRL